MRKIIIILLVCFGNLFAQLNPFSARSKIETDNIINLGTIPRSDTPYGVDINIWLSYGVYGIISSMSLPQGLTYPITSIIADSNRYLTNSGNLVTNGTFDSDVTGWTSVADVFVWDNGEMNIEQIGTGYDNTYQDNIYPDGKTIKYRFKATRNSGGSLKFQQDINTDIIVITESGIYEGSFIGAHGTYTGRIQFRFNNASADWNIDDIEIYEIDHDWNEVGHAKIYPQGDSTATISNVPVELNPNVNFDSWNYINLANNGTFDSGTDWTAETGWTIGSGVASANITGYNSLRQSGTVTVGDIRMLQYDIPTYTSGTIYGKLGTSTVLTGRSSSGTFREVGTVSGTEQLRIDANGGAFVGSIDNVILAELVAPTGWIFSHTMTDSSYIIEDNTNGGFRFVNLSTGSYVNLYTDINLVVGQQYYYTVDLVKNGGTSNINLQEGSNTLIKQFASTTTFTDTFTATQSDYVRFKVSNASLDFDWTVKSFSIKEYHPESYIHLPMDSASTNQKFELVVSAKEGETDLASNGDFETGDLTGWSTNNTPTSSVESSDVYEGNYAWRISADGANEGIYIDNINVEKGDSLHAILMLKSISGNVTLTYRYSPGGGGVTDGSLETNGETTWTKYKLSYYCDRDTTLQFRVLCSAGEEFLVDDARIYITKGSQTVESAYLVYEIETGLGRTHVKDSIQVTNEQVFDTLQYWGTYPVNQSQNPSFENFVGTADDGVDDNFDYWNWSAQTWGLLEASTEYARTGSYSMKQTDTSATGNPYYYYEFPVKQGDSVIVEFYALALEGAVNYHTHSIVEADGDDHLGDQLLPGGYVRTIPFGYADGTWYKVTERVKIKDAINYPYVRVGLFAVGGSGGTGVPTWIDDFSFKIKDRIKISLTETAKVNYTINDKKYKGWNVWYGDTLQINLENDISEVGTFDREITFTGANENHSVSVQGNVVYGSTLVAENGSLNFGTHSSYKLDSILVNNVNLNFASFTFNYGVSSPFGIINPTGVMTGLSHKYIKFTFTPTADGPYADTAYIVYYDYNISRSDTLLIPISGIGSGTSTPSTPTAVLAVTDSSSDQIDLQATITGDYHYVEILRKYSDQSQFYSIGRLTEDLTYTDYINYFIQAEYKAVVHLASATDTSSTVTATQYSAKSIRYYSADGNDSNSGSDSSNAWLTIGKQNTSSPNNYLNVFRSGDSFTDATLTLKTNSVYATYGGSERARVGNNLADPAIDGELVDYVTVSGLEIVGRRGLYLRTSDHFTFRNNYVHHYSNSVDTYMKDRLVYISYCDYGTYEGNTSVGAVTGIYQDMFFFYRGCQYNLIRKNKFYHGTHTSLYFYGNYKYQDAVPTYNDDNSPHHNVIEDNYFWNVYHHGMSFQYGSWSNLIQKNYFERASAGYKSGFQETGYPAYAFPEGDGINDDVDGYATNLYGRQNIFRQNIIRRAGSQYSSGSAYSPSVQFISTTSTSNTVQNCYDTRFYNCTFLYNRSPMNMGRSNSDANWPNLNFDNNVVANTLFWEQNNQNGTTTYLQQYLPILISESRNSAAGYPIPDLQDVLTLKYNFFNNATEQVKVGSEGSTGTLYTIDQFATMDELTSASIGNMAYNGIPPFYPTIPSDSLFQSDTADFDYIKTFFALASNDIVVDQGGFLTTVTSPVTSSYTVTVDDATYFPDPATYGNRISGDKIKFSNGQTANILSISGNTLTLDERVTVSANAGVALDYYGNAPDIGAYEYGLDPLNSPLSTKPTINTQPEDVIAGVGDTVQFTVGAYLGSGTLAYQWWDSRADTAITGGRFTGYNTNTLTLNTLQTSDDGITVRCQVLNTNGSGADFYTYSSNAYITVTGSGVITYDTLYVTQSSDDVYKRSATQLTITANSWRIGNDGTPDTSCVRFTGFTEQSGLQEAWIEGYPSNTGNYEVTFRAWGEDTATPTTFSSDINTMRGKWNNKTTAYSDTTLTGEWTLSYKRLVTVTGIINELISSYTYSNGDIAIYLGDSGSANGVYRGLVAYDDSGTNQLRLILKYSN